MKLNNKTHLAITALILVVVAGAGGFFGGMKFQQSRRNTLFTQTGNGNGGMMRGTTGTRNGPASPRLGGFRPVAGEIIKSDDTSITVKLADGSSKIVLITEKTDIRKTNQGAKNDLTTGTQVAVFGSDNPDGSVTAQNVQINPERIGATVPIPAVKQ